MVCLIIPGLAGVSVSQIKYADLMDTEDMKRMADLFLGLFVRCDDGAQMCVVRFLASGEAVM